MFKEEKNLICKFYVIYLKNVIIVIRETRARHYCLPMGSQNFSITKTMMKLTSSV
jgi:hypothetical protein